jgi:hypothetical protein
VLRDPAATEVIVVQDDDEASTAQAIGEASAGDARVRRVRGNRHGMRPGRAQHARDTGAAAARGEVILALDDDVIARPGLVSGHAARHAGHDDLLVVGYMPVVLPPRGTPGRAAARLYADGYEQACRRFERDPEELLDRLWAGNLSVRRRHWLDAARLPVVPGGYHDDLAFGARLKLLGLRAAFDPALRAEHWYRRTPAQVAVDARESAHGRQRLADSGIVADPAADPPGLGARTVARLGASTRAQATMIRAAEAAGARRSHGAEMLLTRAIWRSSFERELEGARGWSR